MKVDAQRANADAQRLREQDQRKAATEETARRFQKQWLRRRKEEEGELARIAGPFELLAQQQRERQEDPCAVNGIALSVALPNGPDGMSPPSLDLPPVVDMEVVRMDLQESARLDTIARTAMEGGLKAAMAQGRGEYQVELGSVLFTRTRLRVRAGDHLGLDVRCESDSASEREWFDRHRDALAGRIAGLTGRAVRLDIVDRAP